MGLVLVHTRLERVLAWILLIGVFLICVSPAVDLDDCSLGSDQVVSALTWLLAAVLVVVVQGKREPDSHRLRLAFVPDGTPLSPLDSGRIDLIRNRRI